MALHHQYHSRSSTGCCNGCRGIRSEVHPRLWFRSFRGKVRFLFGEIDLDFRNGEDGVATALRYREVEVAAIVR